MVKKSITIPDEIYDQIKDENNFSLLVSSLLTEHIRRRNIDEAKSTFGAIPNDGTDSVVKVNSMRAENERSYTKWGSE